MTSEEEAKLREAVKDAEEVMVHVQDHWLGDESFEPCQICLLARTWLYFHGSDDANETIRRT